MGKLQGFMVKWPNLHGFARFLGQKYNVLWQKHLVCRYGHDHSDQK